MRTLTDLSKAEVGSITRVFRAHGTDRARVSRVAKTFRITESDASNLATAATTAPKSPKVVTESAADLTSAAANTDAHTNRKASLAVKLFNQVQQAEAKPISECSLQELESLAAAAAADAGMFG